jgi:hypothetical protein
MLNTRQGVAKPASSKNSSFPANHNAYLTRVLDEEIEYMGDNIVNDIVELGHSRAYKSEVRSLVARLKTCKTKDEQDYAVALFSARLWRGGVKEGQSGTKPGSDWIISTPGIETWHAQA